MNGGDELAEVLEACRIEIGSRRQERRQLRAKLWLLVQMWNRVWVLRRGFSVGGRRAAGRFLRRTMRCACRRLARRGPATTPLGAQHRRRRQRQRRDTNNDDA